MSSSDIIYGSLSDTAANQKPKAAGQYYFYHTDHLGTPQKITAVNGAVVWSAMYSSFGEAQVLPSSTVENNLRFPGQYYDTETGLHYNYHRYHDPSIGRYLRTDPIGLNGGLNLYLYTRNNPVTWSDPRGLRRFKPLPPSGCEYYKKRCDEGNKCKEKKDEYACKAYDCCQSFGEGPTANCIRGCLIAFDKRNCAHLSGEARNRCRRLAHWDCYDRCNGHLIGAKGLLTTPPPECIDAMEEVGGMGF